MIRIVNFFCFAVSAFACLALYHVSERTRVADVHLRVLDSRIAKERQAIDVLQAEWGRIADPARIQRLAQALGREDRAVVELSSLTLLPQRGDLPLGEGQVRSANAVAPAPDPRLRLASVRSGG